jgi:hypothetical protein
MIQTMTQPLKREKQKLIYEPVPVRDEIVTADVLGKILLVLFRSLETTDRELPVII